MNNSLPSSSKDVTEAGEAVQPAGEFTDKELVDQAAGGDLNAFSLLVKRYQNPVYALLYNLSQKAETADDLTQQTFIKAWRSLAGFEQRSAFSTWIYRIAHNVFYDFQRRKEPVMEDVEGAAFRQSELNPAYSSPTSPSPDEALIRKEQIALFKKALLNLSEEQRSAIVMKEVHGLSYKEIAEISGCSIGTVMSRLHYARQNLRTLLHQNEY